MKRKLEEIQQDENEEAQSKRLGELIRQKKKLSQKKAKFILSIDDLKYLDKSDVDSEQKVWFMPQFFVQDIQKAILYAISGSMLKFAPRWCKILRSKCFKSVVLVTVNNLSEYDYQSDANLFEKFNSMFVNYYTNNMDSIEFISANANYSNFLGEFASVPITRTEWIKLRDKEEYIQKVKEVCAKYKKYFMINQNTKKSDENKKETSEVVSSHEFDKISRVSLLLSVEQMIKEDYPLPFDESTHDVSNYVYTKETYEPVTNTSPIFSIDVEMCYNVDGETVPVWLAVVNERLECVYETYVKPEKPIRNFLTHITGVDANVLKDVTTTLDDVRKKIREILPPNGIICGQSLNNDLHVLKIFHPYVIDTSVIYNLTGNRDMKSSLKRLSVQFLGKLIQESIHNPVIDARASMQLVLLKLRKSLDYGDVIINGCKEIFDDNLTMLDGFENADLSSPETISKFIYQTGLNVDQNLFNILNDYEISTTLIDQKASKQVDNYKHFKYLHAKDNLESFKVTMENVNKSRFIWSQFYIEHKNENERKCEVKQVMKNIRKIYSEIEDDSFFVVVFTGSSKNTHPAGNDASLDYQQLYKGRCFLKHKNEEFLKLEDEVKELYQKLKFNKDSLTNG